MSETLFWSQCGLPPIAEFFSAPQFTGCTMLAPGDPSLYKTQGSNIWAAQSRIGLYGSGA